MRKITYFILIAILLISCGGCSKQKDKDSYISVDNLVSVNGEVENTAKPTFPKETKQKVVESTSNKDTNSENTENENTGNENAENENTDNENTDNENIDEKTNTENINNDNIGKENIENETTHLIDKSDGNADTTGSNNEHASIDKNVIIEKQGLVELIKLDNSFIIDIKYATEDNFAKKKIYTLPICLIHKNTAKKLIAANNEFKSLGYSLKVFDAYRPYSAQQVLWDAAEDKSYLANPKKGSKHNRGAAVDVTLIDGNGKELGMPSGYDEFSERAHLKYSQCDEALIKNRELLGKIMIKHGFKRISTEWWHFDDTDAMNYPLLDIAFEEFVH